VAESDQTADGLALTVTDEDGCSATAHATMALEPAKDAARAEAGLRDAVAKLGNTMFVANDVALNLAQPWFVPSSVINALRREAVEKLEAARLAAWPRQPRKAPVEPPVVSEKPQLLANVYNAKARDAARRGSDRAGLRGQLRRRSQPDDHQALPALLLQPVSEAGQGRQGRDGPGARRPDGAEIRRRDLHVEIRMPPVRDARDGQDEEAHPEVAATFRDPGDGTDYLLQAAASVVS
jgi:hypothetical protein